MLDTKPRVVVIYNRDFEGADADPENKAREDIKDIAEHVISHPRGRALHGGRARRHRRRLRRRLRAARAAPRRGVQPLRVDRRRQPLRAAAADADGPRRDSPTPARGRSRSSLALHKHKAKEILRARGVSTPEAVFLTTPDVSPWGCRFPLIVKPSREDASVGITATRWSGRARRSSSASPTSCRHYRQPALVERYIDGREIYVSMLGRREGAPQVFPILRDRLLRDAGRSAAHRLVRGQVGRGLGRSTAARSRCAARTCRPSCRRASRRRR